MSVAVVDRFHCCRELLRLKILELGEEHLSVGKVMNNLAVLYCLQVGEQADALCVCQLQRLWHCTVQR